MQTTFKRTRISRSVRSILIGSGAALALSAGGTSFAAESDDLEALKDQVRILMERIDQLEQQQASSDQKARDQEEKLVEMQEQVETAPANVVTAGDLPGSFKIPGTDTSVEISGYVKGDFIYDVDSDLGDSFVASSIPLDGSVAAQGGGHTRLHAKQSRLRVVTNTDLGNGGSIGTHIEGDFFGAGGNESFSNSSTFRIRHAYGTYNTGTSELLVGQTWTNFGQFNYMSVVDFFGPAGQVFLRQGQVRYTVGGFSISLENPETDGLGAAGRLGESRGGIGSDELPDLTAAFSFGPGGAGGSYKVSGVVRQLGVDGVAPPGSALAGARLDDTEVGWGAHVGGTWGLSDAVSLTAGVGLGEGIGRYLINGAANDAFVLPNGTIEAVESFGATAGVSFATSDSSSINVSYGYFENDNPAQSNGIDTLQTLHANYIISPWPNTNFGFEVIYGDLDVPGGQGDAVRLQFGAQRSF